MKRVSGRRERGGSIIYIRQILYTSSIFLNHENIQLLVTINDADVRVYQKIFIAKRFHYFCRQNHIDIFGVKFKC